MLTYISKAPATTPINHTCDQVEAKVYPVTFSQGWF